MILKKNEKEKWDYYLKKIKNMDVQYKYEYVRLFAEHEKSEPILYIYENDYGLVYYPFILRKIEGTEYYDITSQYGYGGPILNVEKENKELLLKEFRKEFEKYCKENNVISEFIRFHPMLNNHEGLEKHIECLNISNVIYVDLTKDESEIIKSYKYSNRKSINKAIRENINILKENNLDEFLKIYNSTMERNEALSYYRFEKEFFYSITEKLFENNSIFFAKKEEHYISTELVLYSKDFGHSYLGGTDMNYFMFSPNNLLKHEIIKSLKKKGVKYFILGGGYKKEDGIYKYKLSFNEDGVLPYYVGKKIHNKEIYNELNIELEKKNPKVKENEGYFPLYRRV